MKNKTRTEWDTIIRPQAKWFSIDLKGIIRYRDLIWLLVKRNFALTYKQTILGPAWVIVQPLLTTVVFTVVFGNIAGLPTDGIPKFLFYMAGNIVWQFFSKCLTTTSTTFLANRHIFGKVYFPRLCFPISTVLTQLIRFLIQYVLFILFVIWYATRPGSNVIPNYSLIATTPLILLQLGILGMGCGIIISAVTIKYRDLQMLVGFGEHLWMYVTPITYSSILVAERHPEWLRFYMLNPMTPIVELFRSAYLGVPNYSADYLWVSVVITVFILVLGLVLFSHTEKSFMDKI